MAVIEATRPTRCRPAQDPPRHAADEPARRTADDRDLGRPRLPCPYREDVAALRRAVDIVVASHHWGLNEEVLEYMTEIAHAAIDAGADIVIGHGPHYSLPVEVYRGKPIFYGLGSFSFHTGHGGRKHGDWVGHAGARSSRARIERVSFRFVRHNDRNETVFRAMHDEQDMATKIGERSAPFQHPTRNRG